MNNKGLLRKELLFILAIPVGVFLFTVFFEVANTYYWQWRLDNTTKEILTEALNNENNVTEEDFYNYAALKFKETKYDSVKTLVTLTKEGDNDVYILSNQIKHFSITGYLYSLLNRGADADKYTISVYSGYRDDYNEPIVEKVKDVSSTDDRVYTPEELEEMEKATSTTKVITNGV